MPSSPVYKFTQLSRIIIYDETGIIKGKMKDDIKGTSSIKSVKSTPSHMKEISFTVLIYW